MSGNESLLVERRGNGVVAATLNRPEKLNALDGAMRDGLRELAAELTADREARALLITGAGRGFCSGADMSNRDAALAAEAEPGLQSTDLRYGFAAELQALEIPVIAAINGAAAGAGFAIALACDIRLMSDAARLHPAFIRRGLGPDWAASWTLTRLVGHSRALEIFWTADPIGAERALELGIVNQVHPQEKLMPAALALADRLAGQRAVRGGADEAGDLRGGEPGCAVASATGGAESVAAAAVAGSPRGRASVRREARAALRGAVSAMSGEERPPALRVFEGVRIADFAWVGVGPNATMQMAFHGAEVVRSSRR